MQPLHKKGNWPVGQFSIRITSRSYKRTPDNAHPEVEFPDNPDRRIFSFKTTDYTYGYLIIHIDKPEAYDQYKSVINNPVSIISIELEKRIEA